MAIPKVRATYFLDESSAQDEIARKLSALHELQLMMSHLTPEEWEKWERDTQEIHRSWELPWERDASDSEK